MKSMYHNDYVIVVKQYLRRYKEFGVYISNIHVAIEDIQDTMKLEGVPKVSVLSEAGGCGGSGKGVSPQEVLYFNKESAPARIAELHKKLEEIEPTFNKLKNSLNKLDPEDRSLLMQKWVSGDSWEDVAREVHLSYASCRRRSNVLLEKLAIMIFGKNADDTNSKIIFAK